MKSAKTVGIVVIKGDNVLLVKEGENSGHITGVYNTPAGRIEADETPLQAAVRELNEESGYIAGEYDLTELPKKYVADIKRKNGETMRFYHTVFLCRNISGSMKKSDDVIPVWVPINNISKLQLLPNIEDMINEAQKIL